MEEISKLLKELKELSGASGKSDLCHLTRWSIIFRPMWTFYLFLIKYLTLVYTVLDRNKHLSFRQYTPFNHGLARYIRKWPLHIYVFYAVRLYFSLRVIVFLCLRIILYSMVEHWRLDVRHGSNQTSNCAFPQDIVDPDPVMTTKLHHLIQWSYQLGSTLSPENEVMMINLCVCIFFI